MSIAKWLETNTQDQASAARYWFRTSMGLESIVTDEIRDRLPVGSFYQSHRNVFVALTDGQGNDQELCQIRTADDVYQYLGCCRGIDHTRPSVDKLIAYFKDQVIPLLSAYEGRKYARLTLSFVGKRNFNRFFIENQVNELISAHTNLTPLSNEQKEAKKPGELRLRCHIEEDIAFTGIALQDSPLHRRDWRSIKYTGQLHTPVAAAMVRALLPKEGKRIIDPFCGSGTIIIESAIQYPQHTHWGYDLEEDVIALAGESAALAGVSVTFQMQDSFNWAPERSDYYLISNPPWDEKHSIGGADHPHFIKQLIRLISGSSGAVLLLPEEMVVEMRKNTALPMQQLAQTRVRGKLAWIIKIDSA